MIQVKITGTIKVSGSINLTNNSLFISICTMTYIFNWKLRIQMFRIGNDRLLALFAGYYAAIVRCL